ncbi:sugar transferase [Alloalcanivorax gelatiniphagus]|nr:sugar transferase [Alloalcanivorax gelatiniphagus]
MPNDGAVISTPSQNFLEFEPTRHRRWYERILLNTPLGRVLSLLLVALVPFYLGYGYWHSPAAPHQQLTLGLLAGAFLVNALLSRSLSQYPGGNLIAYQLAVTAGTIAVTLLAIVTLRLGYARKPLFIGFALLMGAQVVAVLLKARFRYTKFALVPGGDLTEPGNCRDFARFLTLKSPRDRRRFDALVVDMKAPLSDEWLRFIERQKGRDIPVLSGKYLNESLEGSVDLDGINRSDLRALKPNPLYLLGKRLLDVAGTLLLLPVALPLLALVALAIRLESPGPALFIQDRVGADNRNFRMLKFRSMRLPDGDESDRPRFADQEEHRITPLGRLIRRSRLDELPQLWNVLKGDMSLIGPRPEQPRFARSFDRAVPFYSYRHMIKPGITGWAQVQQGYACDVVDTRKKVEHDFYYIKHLGPVLDLLIVMKTLHTMVTGFGAR